MDASLSAVMRMMYTPRLTYKPKILANQCFGVIGISDTAHCQKYAELVLIKPGLGFGVKVRP